MDSYRDDQRGQWSRQGNVTDRSEQGSLTRTQQRGAGRHWNKNSENDDDVPSPRKPRQFNANQVHTEL